MTRLEEMERRLNNNPGADLVAVRADDLRDLLAVARAVKANRQAETRNLVEAVKAVADGRRLPRITKTRMAEMDALRKAVDDALDALEKPADE